MSILKSEFDVFLDTNDMLFSRQEYNRLSRRLQEICEASSRKPLRESESDEVRSIEYLLSEFEEGFQRWRGNHD